MRIGFSILMSVLWLGLPGLACAADADDAADEPLLTVPAVEDLATLAASARRTGAPILLVFSAEDCDYCLRLESEVLGPMRKAGEDPARVIVRKVMLEDYKKLRDFQGHTLSTSSYAHRYRVHVTPTIALVNADGEALVPNIVGYQSPDFYPAYLEQAIDVSRELISQGKYHSK